MTAAEAQVADKPMLNSPELLQHLKIPWPFEHLPHPCAQQQLTIWQFSCFSLVACGNWTCNKEELILQLKHNMLQFGIAQGRVHQSMHVKHDKPPQCTSGTPVAYSPLPHQTPLTVSHHVACYAISSMHCVPDIAERLPTVSAAYD